MKRSSFKILGEVAAIPIGVYCAYRLLQAFASGSFYDRAIIGGLALLILMAVYLGWGRKMQSKKRR